MRNYINGIDHIADNGLIASLFLIKEVATIAMITYLLISQFELQVTSVILVLGFFLLFGYVMSRWIKGLGRKLADISLLIYSKAHDFSRMANYFSYSNRLPYFEKDLNRVRYQQISTLKSYGVLQISVQPIIELCFIIFILCYLLLFNGINTSIGDISLVLIAMVRLIPAGSRISSGINSLNYTIPYLNEIFESSNRVVLEKIISLNEHGNVSVSFPQFKYKQKTITRQKLSLSFKPGEIIRLDGASGTGKTSLLNLLASSSSQSDLVVGYVEQFPTFFEGSIYENLTLKKETMDRNEVLKLCRLLAIEESFGSSNEEVFKIMLSDNGENLSGGQRKKLALIREKLKRPQLALFDELNAGLDKKSVDISHKFQIEQFSDIPIIFTTHTEEEPINTDRTLLLSDGYLKEIS
ncbi:ABC transporter ATP-binding protein/permease [Paracoccaceae bacterium]|nr:ABC transporter ATP-binding protein/permease [Paracoccaceae bacterium]